MSDTSHIRVVTHVHEPFARIIIPDLLLERISAWFAQAARAGVEDFVVLAGYDIGGGAAVAVTALHPDVERAPGWYEHRESENLHALYKFGQAHDMHYLMQIHTHPRGASTRHSWRDDAGAFSDQVGFLSAVLPDYGERGCDLLDPQATMHERTEDGWRVWTHAEALARLAVIPSSIDYDTSPTPQRKSFRGARR